MDNDTGGVAEIGDDIPLFDVPDEALERAGGFAEGRIMTWVYCTQAWYNCGWPQ
jgi:hypothetical protein